MSNILMRTDGFKKVVKGLSYKRISSNNNIKSSHNVHTSMGKRSVMKHYEIGNYEQKDTDLFDSEKSQQFRRTKTADYNRHAKKTQVEDREKMFLEAEASERECFASICEKLGI
jgi:hypothetical protein